MPSAPLPRPAHALRDGVRGSSSARTFSSPSPPAPHLQPFPHVGPTDPQSVRQRLPQHPPSHPPPAWQDQACLPLDTLGRRGQRRVKRVSQPQHTQMHAPVWMCTGTDVHSVRFKPVPPAARWRWEPASSATSLGAEERAEQRQTPGIDQVSRPHAQKAGAALSSTLGRHSPDPHTI